MVKMKNLIIKSDYYVIFAKDNMIVMASRKLSLILVLTFMVCISCRREPDKIWLHRANNVEKARYFQDKYAGLEIDITYVDSLKTFLVLHGGGHVEPNPVTLEQWFDSLEKTKGIRLWLDFKNLNGKNKAPALDELNRLSLKYKLRKNNLIVESGNASCLPSFHDDGFQTSFYIPDFKPEKTSTDKIQKHTNEIRNAIEQNNLTTISGYYYQYQFMRDSFPDKDILIWYHLNDTEIRNRYIKLANDDYKVKVLLVAEEIPID